MQTVHIEREVPTTPLAAFDHFTDPDLLTAWWPSEVETDPVVGGSFRLFFEGSGVTLRGRYRRVDPGKQLAFTWKWDHEDLPPRLVDVIFKSSPRGCLVSVTHDAGSDEEASDYANGWIHFLGRLTRAIERSSS
jgi:uncharacterized protein YndB with AHSA1/START domain